MPAHESISTDRRLRISIAITLAVLVAEGIGGLWTGSLALLSDAAHVFMDVFALALSYLALRLAALPPDDRYTYGFHRLEVLAALINGVTLAAVAVGIFAEAWQRWQNPEPVKSLEMLAIAFLGLVANLIVVRVLGGSRHDVHDGEHVHASEPQDVNLRSAYLHVVGDAISSVGVIVAAGFIWATGWLWVDPLLSVLIAILILVSSWRVLWSSLHILIEGAPVGLSVERVGQELAGIRGVQDVHDLHVWSLCSGHIALSAHLVVADRELGNPECLMAELKQSLRDRFGIEHTTIQLERAPCGHGCVGSSRDLA